MSDLQRDREERQHVIEVLQNMVDWMEASNYIVAKPERRDALLYAIASIETDLKYDLLYEGALEQEPTNGEKILNAFTNVTTRIFKNKIFHYIEVVQNDKWIADIDMEWWNSVTPQPKIGKWVLSGGYWRCSECKEKALLKFDKSKGNCKEYMPIRSDFCPYCGAKMVEPQESEDKE